MPVYRCFANGMGYPGALFGEDGTMGFYTTLWVRALNPKKAELKAMEIVRTNLAEDGIDYAGAHVHFEVVRVRSMRHLPFGLTIYPEADDPPSSASQRVRDRLREQRKSRR